MSTLGVAVPDVLLPRAGVNLKKWAVVACDQFTSQLDYWQKVEELVGDAPSTLNLVFPEVYLGKDEPPRIDRIQTSMREYLTQGLLQPLHSMILVRRTTQGPHGPRVRTGLCAVIDLECYDYSKGSQSLVRATEGTILERLPPRIRIREGAPLELPHVMLLIDDPERTVIEPLAGKNLAPLYDTELMLDGGRVSGHAVDAASEQGVMTALAGLAARDPFLAKYHLTGDAAQAAQVLLFAVGDGNHSLATAKAVWERIKATTADAQSLENHPARQALVEIVNVHDAGLDFEPIHRVLFQVKGDLLAAMRERFGDSLSLTPCTVNEIPVRVAGGETHRIGMVSQEGAGLLEIRNPSQALPVATLQPILDAFLQQGGAHSIDYVHGAEATFSLGQTEGNLGLYLPPMPKSDLFRSVILDGALPRKTFSMGEANEKRYYLEARRILP